MIPDRVTSFLRNHRCQYFCDDCLAAALSLSRRQQAQAVTAPLGRTAEFNRGAGSCSNCGCQKTVIRTA